MKLYFISIGIFITLAHCAITVHAQKFEFNGRRKKQTINFKQVKNLIIIPVYINDKGPFNFLLDTGVAQMIITDTTFIKSLNLKKFKEIKIQGYGLGEDVEAILTREVTASVGRSTIKNIPTAIFKNDIFDLSSYLGIKIHGILGYYFFNSFKVKINYSVNKIIFYTPTAKTTIKGTRIPVQIINGKPYLTAEIDSDNLNRKEIKLLVDNGSSHPLLLESLNDTAYPLPPVTISANLGVGINGTISGSMGRISSFKIGNFTFNEVLAGFPEFNTKRMSMEGESRNGTLGADILGRFLVTFDYRNEAIYLKRGHDFNRKFEHDMSGLEIFVKQGTRNHFLIGRIEQGSPADVSGLKVGDEIININLKDIQSYDLSQLTQLMKEGDGKRLIVEVLREDIRHIVLLHLKKRI